MPPLQIIRPLVMATLLLCCTPSGASSISIVDTISAFPFLRNVEDSTNVMRWDSGTAIQLLSSCKLIRITRRGVRCIAAGMELVAGWDNMFTHMGPSSGLCQPHRHALCVMGTGTRLFPTDTVFVADRSVAKCVNGQGRQLVPDQDTPGKATITTHKVNHTRRDDISLCDIIDTNLDIVYDPVNNQIFTRQLNNSATLYVSISILILVVVVLKAEAISNNTRSNLTHNIVAWILLVGLSLLMLTHVDGRMHPIITVHDYVFLCIVLVYIIVSTLYWVASCHGASLHGTAAAVAEKTPQSNSDETHVLLPVTQVKPTAVIPDQQSTHTPQRPIHQTVADGGGTTQATTRQRVCGRHLLRPTVPLYAKTTRCTLQPRAVDHISKYRDCDGRDVYDTCILVRGTTTLHQRHRHHTICCSTVCDL